MNKPYINNNIIGTSSFQVFLVSKFSLTTPLAQLIDTSVQICWRKSQNQKKITFKQFIQIEHFYSCYIFYRLMLIESTQFLFGSMYPLDLSFSWSIYPLCNHSRVFFLFPLQPLLREHILSSKSCNLLIQTAPEEMVWNR